MLLTVVASVVHASPTLESVYRDLKIGETTYIYSSLLVREDDGTQYFGPVLLKEKSLEFDGGVSRAAGTWIVARGTVEKLQAPE